MGNAATKEAGPSHLRRSSYSQAGASTDGAHIEQHQGSESPSRHLRRNRHDFSFLGIATSDERDAAYLGHRRENRQEREARKREKERALRLQERKRSMSDEHVDGGYLVTQGVYVGSEDFSKPIIRQLMIERRLAPFWRGLNDISTSWAEHQIIAAARGIPIPPADEVPQGLLEDMSFPSVPADDQPKVFKDKNLNTLTVPMKSRSQSFNSDGSSSAQKDRTPPTSKPSITSPGSPPLFRGRAKTLASLTTSSNSHGQLDMSPRELHLPHDPFVNGQRLELYLYKDPMECPICFLWYPSYLNRTRCCDQPICSECFVQIKRAEPHPPDHEDLNANERLERNDKEPELISEPAACPFCVQPEFGVHYESPPFRRGLSYVAKGYTPSPLSSASNLSSNAAAPQPSGGRRRAMSLSADAPNVITTDKIRPDWAQKLVTARENAIRRAAAATALHSAAYVTTTGGDGHDSRGPGVMPRRGLLFRRNEGSDSSLNRYNAYAGERQDSATEGEPSHLPRSGGGMSHSRVEEIEEMMMMEAIRLSLASEDERRKKLEKDQRKQAKRAEKEAKRAERNARRYGSGSTLIGSNGSSTNNSSSNVALSAAGASSDNVAVDKGKSANRAETPEVLPSSAPATGSSDLIDLTEERTESTVSPAAQQKEPSNLSRSTNIHLRRQHSSGSSSHSSSLVESAIGDQIEAGSAGGPSQSTPSIDPLYNFSSLAAMIDSASGGAERPEQSELRPAAALKSEDGHFTVNAISKNTEERPAEPDTHIQHENINQLDGAKV